MDAYNRVNRAGRRYYISEMLDSKSDTRTVIRTIVNDIPKHIVVDHDIDKVMYAWESYLMGISIQTAFNFFTPDEREFLITGLTSADWDELFPPEVTV